MTFIITIQKFVFNTLITRYYKNQTVIICYVILVRRVWSKIDGFVYKSFISSISGTRLHTINNNKR